MVTSLAMQNMTLDGKLLTPIEWDMATLVRCDIAGFTAISATLSSAEVQDMLTRLYDKMDGTLRFYGVDKVDIVGDAYYALSRHPRRHATSGICFGLHAMEIAKHTPICTADAGRGNLSVRVAVHSGPVVLIALNAAAFKYSLIGETFNVVTALETTCVLDTVHVSEAAVAQVPPDLRRHFQLSRQTQASFSVTHVWRNETIVCGTTLAIVYATELTLHWLQFEKEELRSFRMLLGPTTHTAKVCASIKKCLDDGDTVYLETDIYNRAGDAIPVSLVMARSSASELRVCMKPIAWTTSTTFSSKKEPPPLATPVMMMTRL